MLIFDSKLSVTEHNRTQLFINYDFVADRFLSIAVHYPGPEQSMKIDYRKINRSIDDNRLITVD